MQWADDVFWLLKFVVFVILRHREVRIVSARYKTNEANTNLVMVPKFRPFAPSDWLPYRHTKIKQKACLISTLTTSGAIFVTALAIGLPVRLSYVISNSTGSPIFKCSMLPLNWLKWKNSRACLSQHWINPYECCENFG